MPPVPLDEIARRYASQLFAQKLETVTREQQKRVAEITNDCTRRGITRSGIFVKRLLVAGIKHMEAIARARQESLLAAYEEAHIRLDDEAVDEISASVRTICESKSRSLTEGIRQTAHQVGMGDPGEWIVPEVQTGMAGTVARVARDLRIRRDEAILRERQAPRPPEDQPAEWDAFISHAGEDKEAFVRPLAEALARVPLRVWYDEFTLNVGDSLRESIDHGLAHSRFGVVVLSPNFFGKNWPKLELDGLFAQQAAHGRTILPVWHNVTEAEVRRFSPILAGRVAACSIDGLETVVEKLVRAIRRD